jgi:hypothetical protein
MRKDSQGEQNCRHEHAETVEWRLAWVFTTGTAKTKVTLEKIVTFPIKARSIFSTLEEP